MKSFPITCLRCPIFKLALFVGVFNMLQNTPAFAVQTSELLNFSEPASKDRIQLEGFAGSSRELDGLHLTLRPNSTAAIAIAAPNNCWDLWNWTRLVVDCDNLSTDASARIRARVENDDASDWFNVAMNEGYLRAGDRHRMFNVFLQRDEDDLKYYPPMLVFSGMKGLPGGWMPHWRSIDPGKVRRVKIDLTASDKPATLVLHRLVVSHPVVSPTLLDLGKEFFPFVDRYGQYIHDDWAGKVHKDGELLAAVQAERADLVSHPPSADWDQYGGSKFFSPEKVLGFFYVEKIDGRWWLIDPEGRRFWSHGVCAVGDETGTTSVMGRENYFAELPAAPTHPDSGQVNFFRANLQKQFGNAWQSEADELAIRRLQSWRMNTLANWSRPAIEQKKRVPYTREIHLWQTRTGDSLFDVFDPAWQVTAKKVIDDESRPWRDDPWCIGFFIDNEIPWEGSARDFVGKLFASRSDSFTKREFVKTLRESQADRIESLNAALDTHFADWDAVIGCKTKLKSSQIDNIGSVADAFFQRFADTYFDTVGPTIKSVAPHKLYLGCRFHVTNDIATRSAARYADVLSFNLYRPDVSGFSLPPGVDKPILVSEFHFGAVDRGMFHTGLQPASDQRDRADKYRAYVHGALSNPRIVGTHWFEYVSEALTGRSDGENYNDGLIDVCNQPYPELREAVREVGDELYRAR